uniref:Uncharacterized protein n=1 Tax=Ditylenchus dipsaci TaxID=166011 RepID=A0A915E4E5_9BILA
MDYPELLPFKMHTTETSYLPVYEECYQKMQYFLKNEASPNITYLPWSAVLVEVVDNSTTKIICPATLITYRHLACNAECFSDWFHYKTDMAHKMKLMAGGNCPVISGACKETNMVELPLKFISRIFHASTQKYKDTLLFQLQHDIRKDRSIDSKKVFPICSLEQNTHRLDNDVKLLIYGSYIDHRSENLIMQEMRCRPVDNSTNSPNFCTELDNAKFPDISKLYRKPSELGAAAVDMSNFTFNGMMLYGLWDPRDYRMFSNANDISDLLCIYLNICSESKHYYRNAPSALYFYYGGLD